MTAYNTAGIGFLRRQGRLKETKNVCGLCYKVTRKGTTIHPWCSKEADALLH